MGLRFAIYGTHVKRSVTAVKREAGAAGAACCTPPSPHARHVARLLIRLDQVPLKGVCSRYVRVGWRANLKESAIIVAWLRTAEQIPLIAPESPAETLEAGRVMTRALTETTAPSDRLGLACGIGYRAVAAWWQMLTAADPNPSPLRAPLLPFGHAALSPAACALADSMGRAAARLDAEAAAYQIGLAYTGMLPEELRGAQGIYYTPPALTARLIAQATEAGTDWVTARVLDPACGGGAFLTSVARKMIDALPGCSPRILLQNIATRLHGYELDPFGAWLSQVSLDAACLPVSRASGRQLPPLVTVCDSLRQREPDECFDLVIGNPPYRRVTLAAADRARFSRSLYGHANLYGLFTDMALRHARPGGVIAYVTPTSFLAGEYFKNLRGLLGREAPPATIDFVSARKGVFDSVLQETLLATYRRGGSAKPLVVHEITPANGAAVATMTGMIGLPPDPSQPWLLPRSASEAPLVARLLRMKHRLAGWGYGVSTGPLVWNRHKDQLVRTPGRNRRPLIWAESITADGRFIYRAEKRNHAPYFEVRRGDDWLVVDYPCVLLQRTTAKEQSRRLIAAALPEDFLAEHGAVVVENHLNMLRPITAAPCVPADVLAAFLNSAAADRAFRCGSGSVAVSAYELEALPLPAPHELDELRSLVRRRASRQRIEMACARLYDGAD